jgi:hypothetical protein
MAYIFDCAMQVVVIMTITYLANKSSNTISNSHTIAMVVQVIILCNILRCIFSNTRVDSSKKTDFKLEINVFIAYAVLFLVVFPKLGRITIMFNVLCLVLFAISAYNCVDFCAVSWPLIHIIGAGTVYFMLKDLGMI